MSKSLDVKVWRDRNQSAGLCFYCRKPILLGQYYRVNVVYAPVRYSTESGHYTKHKRTPVRIHAEC